MAEFITALAGGERLGPDFAEALQIQRVIDALVDSSKNRRWVTV